MRLLAAAVKVDAAVVRRVGCGRRREEVHPLPQKKWHTAVNLWTSGVGFYVWTLR